VIGSHFSRFYAPEDRERGLPARALAIARAEGRFEGEGIRVRKDGTRFWAHVVIDPIYSPAGELIGFAKVTRDISERKEAEKALERAGMTVNKNTVPFDEKSPFVTSGFRVGTPALTTRGMKEPEMAELGVLMAKILDDMASEKTILEVREATAALAKRFPLYA